MNFQMPGVMHIALQQSSYAAEDYLTERDRTTTF
jgi:hypothetical protein